jgi:hypothetical protein
MRKRRVLYTSKLVGPFIVEADCDPDWPIELRWWSDSGEGRAVLSEDEAASLIESLLAALLSLHRDGVE